MQETDVGGGRNSPAESMRPNNPGIRPTDEQMKVDLIESSAGSACFRPSAYDWTVGDRKRTIFSRETMLRRVGFFR
jgi:hypothetical protein